MERSPIFPVDAFPGPLSRVAMTLQVVKREWSFPGEENAPARLALACATLRDGGRMALARTADTEFDIALLDLNLKDENSLPVAQRLRSNGKRFIFATGYDGLPPGCGFTDELVISKPYRLEQLAAIIAKALST